MIYIWIERKTISNNHKVNIKRRKKKEGENKNTNKILKIKSLEDFILYL